MTLITVKLIVLKNRIFFELRTSLLFFVDLLISRIADRSIFFLMKDGQFLFCLGFCEFDCMIFFIIDIEFWS